MKRGTFSPLNQLHDRRNSMADQPEEHLTTTEARAGNSSPVNRVALFGGLIAVVLIFAVILFVAR